MANAVWHVGAHCFRAIIQIMPLWHGNTVHIIGPLWRASCGSHMDVCFDVTIMLTRRNYEQKRVAGDMRLWRSCDFTEMNWWFSLKSRDTDPCYLLRNGINPCLGCENMNTILQTKFSLFLVWGCSDSNSTEIFLIQRSISNISTLIKTIARCRTGNKPLSEPMMA